MNRPSADPTKHPAPPIFTDHTGTRFAPRFALRRRDAALLSELMTRSREELFVITDPSLPDNALVYVSPSFREYTGYASEEVIGRNCRFLQGPRTHPSDIKKIRTAIAAQREVTLRLVNYRKDGTLFVNQFFLTTLRKAVPRGRLRLKPRPWVVRVVDRMKGERFPSGVPMRRDRREPVENVYYLGVLCECDHVDRNLIMNFGANFRAKQPEEEYYLEEEEEEMQRSMALEEAVAQLEISTAGENTVGVKTPLTPKRA
uniref:Putative LOV domain-containing protein n=1 Tax=Rhodochaete parvula TaxID=110510 RepID=A0A126WYE6_9RHOD|nr:putative LOV domain-containing protein [Rhodochaete parvula]